MKFIRDIRFLLFVVLILGSLFLLMPKSKIGVVVSYAEENNPCGFESGEIINYINNVPTTTTDEFIEATRYLDGIVTFQINQQKPKTCSIELGESLNITVTDMPTTNLMFGMDIQGGTRVLLQPIESVSKETMVDVENILRTRMDFFGLQDMSVRTVGPDIIEIQMAGARGEEIREFLAKEGKFEAKISEAIDFEDEKGVIIVGGEEYEVILKDNSTVVINGSEYENEDEFVLGGIDFEVSNITDGRLFVYADVFDNKDVITVYTDPQRSGFGYDGQVYNFYFTVQISKQGAKRFAEITRGQQVTIDQSGRGYLRTPMVLFLDEKPMTELNIAADLAGQEIQTPSITGARETREEATKEKLRLESILRSGNLPVKLEIVKIDTISPTLGKEFLNSVVWIAIVGSIIVSVIIIISYRNFKIAIPIILISLSEALLILGSAAASSFAGFLIFAGLIVSIYKGEIKGWLAWLLSFSAVLVLMTIVISPWTLDIPAIVGLVVVIGSSVNQMIIITDQLLLKEGGRKEREETSMHMVWSGFMILVATMSVMIWLGVGTLKGLAITTILEEYIGVFITRPAFASILERFKTEE